MLISNVSQAMHGELRKADPVRRAKSEQAAGDGVRADSSELSADGKKQRDTRGEVQIISSMIKAQPDVRMERVAEAKVRISNGFYNSSAFAEQLAAKMIDTVV
jgi:anti-sigma28 factor (negative regulator of flagellin synthesis)